MEEPNYLNLEIDASDWAVKRVLATKEILARILVLAIPEFEDYSFEEAIAAIEGEPEVGTRNLRPAPEAINGEKNESKLPGEGTVYFDIVFSVRTKEGKRQKLIINLEAQNNSNPGYTISARGVVYCARLISEQLDKEFTTSTYDDAKKVYSIWICMQPPKNHSDNAIPANKIVRYYLVPDIVWPPNASTEGIAFGVYDLMSVIIITLVDDPDKTDNELIGMLSTLLSSAIDAATKKKKLSKKYGIPLTREINEEVSTMYNLGQGLIQKTIEETEEKYIAELAEKDETIAAKNEALAAKDTALSEKDAELSAMRAKMAELEAQLAVQQKQNI